MTAPWCFRQDKTPILLTHDGEASQALAQVFWPVNIDPDADPQAARVMAVLASIMRLKVTAEIREALGATYSPSAGSSLSSLYPGWGYVSAGAEVKPEDADKVIQAMEKIVVGVAGRVRQRRRVQPRHHALAGRPCRRTLRRMATGSA